MIYIWGGKCILLGSPEFWTSHHCFRAGTTRTTTTTTTHLKHSSTQKHKTHQKQIQIEKRQWVRFPQLYLGLTLPTPFLPLFTFQPALVVFALPGSKDESLAARWRRGPPSDAVEILELERQKELEMWTEFRRKNEDIDLGQGRLGWCLLSLPETNMAENGWKWKLETTCCFRLGMA